MGGRVHSGPTQEDGGRKGVETRREIEYFISGALIDVNKCKEDKRGK